MMKTCNKCKKEKDLENFINKSKEYKTCITCRDKSRKWRKENKERVSKYNKLTVKKRNNGKKVIVVLAKKIEDDENSWIEYSTQREASLKLNVYTSNINKVIKGKFKQTGGYMFKTIEKINKIDVESWEKIKKDNNYVEKCKGQPSKQRILHEKKDEIDGKKCCTCKEWKPLTNYNYAKNHWDKLRSDCKGCLVIYRKKNRRKIQDNMNIYEKNRKLVDPSFKLSKTLRSRVGSALRAIKGKKSSNTMALTGCNLDFLKKHIENQFIEGMTWENHGDWHVDHIIPCSCFDLANSVEQTICFNWRNLQPLWAYDNLSKSNKYTSISKEQLFKDVLGI